MKRIKLLIASTIVIIFGAIAGCGNSDVNQTILNQSKTEQKDQSTRKGTEELEQQLEKIKQDFIDIGDNLTAENIEKVTGITPTVIKDGVEEYGKFAYQYKFDYGYDYEAYIEYRYSHDPKTTYDYDTAYAKLTCPDQLFINPDLDLSGITEDQLRADIELGIKVSAINNRAGGEGYPQEYQTSYKNGKASITTLVWADENNNSINSTLRGGTDKDLPDKTLSLVKYNLRQ